MSKEMKIEKVIILPGTHIPDENKKALSAVIQFICDYRPDHLIHLGDLSDFASLSKFNVMSRAELRGLDFEISETKKFLDTIDQIVPSRCKKIVTLGNHDQRPEIYSLNNWDAKTCKLLGRDRLDDFETMFNMKKRGWKVIPFGEVYTLGHANFTHGWYTNQFHAAKTVKSFFKSIYYEHAHDNQSFTIVGMDGKPVEAMNIGTLQTVRPTWKHGKPTTFVNAFAYMDLWGKNFTMHHTKIIDGSFVAEGKYYNG